MHANMYTPSSHTKDEDSPGFGKLQRTTCRARRWQRTRPARLGTRAGPGLAHLFEFFQLGIQVPAAVAIPEEGDVACMGRSRRMSI